MTANSPVPQQQGFRPSSETAVAAVEAHARSEVESRYVIAIRRPRDWDEVRGSLLRECERPGFAEAALYNKPIGQGVEGASIRFAEAAILAMKNLYIQHPAIYDDDKKRIVRVSVTDLESNTTYARDVTVRKEVERKKLRKNQTPLATRTNSWGDEIYIVEASDDDILNKEGALISKALRTLALRVLPGWLLEEAITKVKQTLRSESAKDPDADKRKIADGFASLNISPTKLKSYLGHDLGTCTPVELIELRALFAAIKDGEASWNEAMEAKHGEDEPETGSATDRLKEKLKNGKKKKEPAPADPEAEPDPQPDETGSAPDLWERIESAKSPDDLAAVLDDVYAQFKASLLLKKERDALLEACHERGKVIGRGKGASS